MTISVSTIVHINIATDKMVAYAEARFGPTIQGKGYRSGTIDSVADYFDAFTSLTGAALPSIYYSINDANRPAPPTRGGPTPLQTATVRVSLKVTPFATMECGPQ